MNTPILPTKRQLDERDFFMRRHENNIEHASPALLSTIDQNMPPPVIVNSIKTMDNLMVGLGPRMMLMMMADTCMGLITNSPPVDKRAMEIELGSWNRALYMLANHPTKYLEMAQEFELLRAVKMRDEVEPGDVVSEKPKTDS